MTEQNEKAKKKISPDLIVISAIVFVAVLLLLFSFLGKKEGAFIVVEIGGEVAGEYSLSENGTYSLNGGTNVLVIENGEAYLSYSNCPDHTCERTGKIRFVGQTIICLPNRVSISVKGDAEGGVDIIS